MDALIRRPAPLLVAPLRSVLAVAGDAHDLICGLGGLLATLADAGAQVRLACCSSGSELEDKRRPHPAQLCAVADELAADEVVTVPPVDAAGAGLEDRIAGLIADSDAVVVVDAGDERPASPAREAMGADEGHRRLSKAASRAAARQGRLLLEWLGPFDLPAHRGNVPSGAWSNPSDLLTLAVDRPRQRRAAARLTEAPGRWTEAMSAASGYDRVRVRHAPYGPRLERLRERLGPLLRPDAAPQERREALHVLMAFARGGGWPRELLSASSGDEPASHPLHEEPGWSLASVVLRAGQATSAHRHESWGAAVTIIGLERNLRYAGWPEFPRFLDEQIAPVGGGYLFEPELCHQAADGSGALTVSLHLLVRRAVNGR